jgi:tRNA (Thr-GGU) A37 N-methylase
MSRILRFISQAICLHNTEVKRVAGARIYIECLDCMKTTPGVEVKGHRYAEAR